MNGITVFENNKRDSERSPAKAVKISIRMILILSMGQSECGEEEETSRKSSNVESSAKV